MSCQSGSFGRWAQSGGLSPLCRTPPPPTLELLSPGCSPGFVVLGVSLNGEDGAIQATFLTDTPLELTQFGDYIDLFYGIF